MEKLLLSKAKGKMLIPLKIAQKSAPMQSTVDMSLFTKFLRTIINFGKKVSRPTTPTSPQIL